MVNSYFLRKKYSLTKGAIFDRITLHINSIFYDNNLRITPEIKFIEDLGADSLESLEFILALEDSFDIVIPDKVQNKSIQDFINIIFNMLNAKEEEYHNPPAKASIISNEILFELVKKRIYDLYPDEKFIITPKTKFFDNSNSDLDNKKLLRLAFEKVLKIEIKRDSQKDISVQDVINFIGNKKFRDKYRKAKIDTSKFITNKKNLESKNIEKKYAMTKGAIFDLIKERINGLYPDKKFIITPKTQFRGNDKEFAELILTFADTFKIKMPPQPRRNVKTIQNVIDHVFITLNAKEEEYHKSSIATAIKLAERDLTREIIFKEYALTEAAILRVIAWQIKRLLYPNTKVKDLPNITPKTSFKDDLDVDIFEFEELILAFENIFEIIIPREISETFVLIDDVISYVFVTLNTKEEESRSIFLLYACQLQDLIIIGKLIKAFVLHIDYSSRFTTIENKVSFVPGMEIKQYAMTKGAIFDRLNLIIQNQLEIIESTGKIPDPPDHGRPTWVKVRVTGETTFNEISTDSLEFTEIMFTTESGFGIDMPREASEAFVLVQDVVDYIFVMLTIKEIEGEKRKKLPGELAREYGLVEE